VLSVPVHADELIGSKPKELLVGAKMKEDTRQRKIMKRR
jgi:hypothetical protein